MTCTQLGGPENCGEIFTAETFEEMAQKSKKHGMEMFAAKDAAHLEAGAKMKALMESGKMQEWFEGKKKEFEALPDES